MDVRRWRTPGIILAVLIVFYLFSRARETRYTTPIDQVFAIEAQDVGRFVISEGDKSVELVRQSDTLWEVTGHPEAKLRQWRLDRLFDGVLEVRQESMVSDNPAKWATYGVDDSSGRRLEVYDLGDRLEGSIVVGQSSTNWQSSHIRPAGGDAVYLTRQSIYHLIAADSSFWLEPPPPPAAAKEEEEEN